MTPTLVDAIDGYLRRQYAWRWSGSVLDAAGTSMECAGSSCRALVNCCEIVDAGGRRYAGEVIGFRGQRVLAMPLEGIEGIRHGDTVIVPGSGGRNFPAGEGHHRQGAGCRPVLLWMTEGHCATAAPRTDSSCATRRDGSTCPFASRCPRVCVLSTLC